MRTIQISLNDGVFAELERAAQVCAPGFSAAQFATEAVESVLASRRLPGVPKAKIGAQINVPEPDFIEHRLVLPEGVCRI